MPKKLSCSRVRALKRGMLSRSPVTECHYCGKRLQHGGLTLDHVVPLSAGGSGGLRNIVPCCLKCNQKKGSKSYSEFVKKIDPNCSYLRSVAHG